MAYDLLGYDVLGDDLEGDDDVLGAEVAPGGLRNARWAKQLRKGAPGAPAISEMMLPLGLGAATFTFGGSTTATLTAIPQLAYRGERIILSAFATIKDNTVDAAALFEVVDIKVGQRSQLVSPQSIPASAFTPTAFGVRLAVDPAVPGIVISVTVRYIGPALAEDEQAVITGTILGRAAG